jgi:hypothetical protein
MSKKSDDRAAYEERAARVRKEKAEGKRVIQIIAERHAESQRALLKRALEQDRKDKRK